MLLIWAVCIATEYKICKRYLLKTLEAKQTKIFWGCSFANWITEDKIKGDQNRERDIDLEEIFNPLCAAPFPNRFNPENLDPCGLQPFFPFGSPLSRYSNTFVKTFRYLCQDIQKLWCETNIKDHVSKLRGTYTCSRIICDQLIKDLSSNVVSLTKVFVVRSWISPQCKTNVQRVNCTV